MTNIRGTHTDTVKRRGLLGGGDEAVRRRVDVTRVFARWPGERLRAQEVWDHTVGTVEQVRELLEELTNSGWLRSATDGGHVVYWRERAT